MVLTILNLGGYDYRCITAFDFDFGLWTNGYMISFLIWLLFGCWFQRDGSDFYGILQKK